MYAGFFQESAMNTSFAFSLALVLGSLTFTSQGFGQVLSAAQGSMVSPAG